MFQEYKRETLEKSKKVIEKYKEEYEKNLKLDCNLLKDNITVKFCETEKEKQKWTAFVHLTTSLPYRGAVGRQVKIFIYCGDCIIGMVHLTSPMAQLKLRDEYIKFTDKWNQLKQIYNIETCVAIPKYSNLLTGKLLVYIVFSEEVVNYLKNKYKTNVIGFETTSLYGKSSLYNRIDFLKYLGLSEGMSAVYIKDEEWKKILQQYKEIYPNTNTNRIAPVKYQIVDKLSGWYKKNNIDFPYKYKSECFKRGVYFGYYNKCTTETAIENWRNRWLIGRAKRLNVVL